MRVGRETCCCGAEISVESNDKPDVWSAEQLLRFRLTHQPCREAWAKKIEALAGRTRDVQKQLNEIREQFMRVRSL